jgi:DNA-binding NtrC family response regulator
MAKPATRPSPHSEGEDRPKATPVVHVVDDDDRIRWLAERMLANEGYDLRAFSGGREAIAAMEIEEPAAVLLDVMMPGMDGLEVLGELQRSHPRVSVVMMSAVSDVDTAVEAMRSGAMDYQVKPMQADRLRLAVRDAVERALLRTRVHELESRLNGGDDGRTIGRSRAMLAANRQIEQAARSGITVLILGESGTGKELAARSVHEGSDRAGRPFVAINCGAIPETLQDSELFGHERGAFTGASDRRRGRIEMAHGGTLFLDEVAELAPSTQSRLLRVLQERSLERVGGEAAIPVDLRIVAATHRDLAKMVREGTFREDLYYRLAVFPVELPPLRDRGDDVILLAHHFLRRFAREESKTVGELSDEALVAIERHPWPGNVRELENSIHRAVVTASAHRVELRDLPLGLAGPGVAPLRLVGANEPQASPTRADTLDLRKLERAAIQRALQATDGNVSEAARRLGIGRTTLYRKMAAFGMAQLG